jgi:hypothetical protein
LHFNKINIASTRKLIRIGVLLGRREAQIWHAGDGLSPFAEPRGLSRKLGHKRRSLLSIDQSRSHHLSFVLEQDLKPQNLSGLSVLHERHAKVQGHCKRTLSEGPGQHLILE